MITHEGQVLSTISTLSSDSSTHNMTCIALTILTKFLSFQCLAMTSVCANQIEQLIYNKLFWKMKFIIPRLASNTFLIKFNLIIGLWKGSKTNKNTKSSEKHKKKKLLPTNISSLKVALLGKKTCYTLPDEMFIL